MEVNISMQNVKGSSNRSNTSLAIPEMGTNVKGIAQLIPIAIIIIIANTLVLVAFREAKKSRALANYILISLAITDLMTGIVNIPLFMIVSFTSIISSSTVRFYLGFLVTVVHTTSAVSSVYHILFATFEKYLAIIWPITHLLTARATIRRTLLAIWLLSIAIGLVPFSWSDKIFSPSGAKCSFHYVIGCFIAVFILPYTFMIYAFVKIFSVISRRIRIRKMQGLRRKRKLIQERKCVAIFVIMAALFAICWFPWFSIMLLFTLDYKSQSLYTLSHVFTLVRYITSIVNPFLYSFLRPNFYGALKKQLKKGANSVGIKAFSLSQHSSRSSCQFNAK